MKRVKKIFSMVLVLTMVLQMIVNDYRVFAEEPEPGKNGTGKNRYSGLVWNDETTEEILMMVNDGLDLENFFVTDLSKGITEADLIQWQSEGKDIADVVLERANEMSDSVSNVLAHSNINNNTDNPIIENGLTPVQGDKAKATPDGSGKIYVTTCTPYDGVSKLSSDKLFNPKKYSSATQVEETIPYYITLGSDKETTMCFTYGAGAGIHTGRTYTEYPFGEYKGKLKSPAKDANYPMVDLLRGCAFAYERLCTEAGIAGHDFKPAQTGSTDADLTGMYNNIRTIAGIPDAKGWLQSLASSSGVQPNEKFYSIFQIMTWQISCGMYRGYSINRRNEFIGVLKQMYPGLADSDYVGLSYIYAYYAKMADECAGYTAENVLGDKKYTKKFQKTNVSLFVVNESNDDEEYQDFITWGNDGPEPVEYDFTIEKTGKLIPREKYPNATFYVYSDPEATNKIGQFTTNENGNGYISLVQGVYYLREITAPVGMKKSDAIVKLEVDDNTGSFAIENQEISNGVLFQKFSSTTNTVVPVEGTYALYEYCSGINDYRKMATFSFTETGFTTASGLKVPPYSYHLASGTTMTYHNEDGTVSKTVTDSSFKYTRVNEGKFRIVEEVAPDGFILNTAKYDFTMTMTDGYVNTDYSITYDGNGNEVRPSTRIKDTEKSVGVKIEKYDALSAERLEGVEFEIQERIGSEWLTCGKLVYDSTERIYKTSASYQPYYILHSSTGGTAKIVTGTDYPLKVTDANKGKFRLVETVTSDENYVNKFIRQFKLNDVDDNSFKEFKTYNSGEESANSGAKNLGKSITVGIDKIDSITKENLLKTDICTLSVYEKNTVRDEWQKVGNLKYNETTDLYELDETVYYTPHRANGALSTATKKQNEYSTTGVYLPGYLYYTSVNKGQYKVVETVNPNNYENGNLTNSGLIVNEREFTITASVNDKQHIDLTSTPAVDTGKHLNVELMKYDVMTGEIVESGDAEFTVYENVNNQWHKLGVLKYDSTDQTYKSETECENYEYVNSNNQVVDIDETQQLLGIHYTNANQGRFKIKETKAPSKYTLGTFEEEFTIDDVDSDDKVYFKVFGTSAPDDMGIKGTVSVKKYDAITEELVKTSDTKVTLYEKINGKWFEMGILAYDASTKSYKSLGTTLTYRDNSEQVIDTSKISDFEDGYLYYTTANKGQFKIVETVPPTNYTLTHILQTQFSREFTLVTDNQVFDYDDLAVAIKNYGVKVVLKISKYDALSKDVVTSQDALFTVQEYLVDLNKWVDVTTLHYDTTLNLYVSNGQTVQIHKPNGTVGFTNTDGDLYFTTVNMGRYRVIETTPPTNYVTGSVQFVKEFNITTDVKPGAVIDLTSYADSPKNTGIYEKLYVRKFDIITNEEVDEKDAVFTVYEFIENLNKWVTVGELLYDESTRSYNGNDVLFDVHDKTGTKVDTSKLSDFKKGELHYTTANKGRFKVVETKAPTNYTQEPILNNPKVIWEKEFTVDTDKYNNTYITSSTGARNSGIYTSFDLLKYDYITKQNVEFTNAIFIIEEKIGTEWYPVSTLKFDETTRTYTTKNVNVVLHNSVGKNVYSATDGKLYYTTANKGQFRVRETSAPDYYILGSKPFTKEFNVKDAVSNTMDLTSQINGAKDLGIYNRVQVRKYDSITKEEVRSGDVEFTVYEYNKVSNTYLEIGKLKYKEDAKLYVCDGVVFNFHNEDGTVATVNSIPDFGNGRLYYTTANQGKFKIKETKAPKNYLLGSFEKNITVTENGKVQSFATSSTGALNEGVSAPCYIDKYDSITGSKVEFKDTVFEIQEWSESTGNWITLGNMNYDTAKKVYSTKGMTATYHKSNGTALLPKVVDELTYTSENIGKFRVLEITPPTNYTPGSVQFLRAFSIVDDVVSDASGNKFVDLSGVNDGAYNLGEKASVTVAKYDSITKEKVSTGDAEFTVYEYIEEQKKWMSVGVLVYNKTNKEYSSDGAKFVFHNEKGEEIDSSTITDFEEGALYYTTANDGKFKVVETKAPSHYNIDGYDKEFNIIDTGSSVSLTSYENAAKDTGFSAKLALVKTDSINGEMVPGATFEAQEWSVNNNTWLSIGTLIDNNDGTYTTKGMKVNIHTGNNGETVQRDMLTHTSQNNGMFRVVEVKAPEGYNNDMYQSEPFTIDTDLQTIELTSEELQAKDTPIRVGISKVSVTTGKLIIGATLTVKDSEGNVIDSWVTDDKEHIISAIPAGKYTLIEERAADGYIVSRNVEFEVTETMEIQKVVMYDDEVVGEVVINKTDKDTGKKLKGAKFEIRDEDGNVIETLVTDENGYAKSGKISFGIYDDNGTYKGSKKYKLVETQAPSGYEKDFEPCEFTFEYVNDTTPVVTKTFNVTNTFPNIKTGDVFDTLPLVVLLSAALVVLWMFLLKKRRTE